MVDSGSIKANSDTISYHPTDLKGLLDIIQRALKSTETAIGSEVWIGPNVSLVFKGTPGPGWVVKTMTTKQDLITWSQSLGTPSLFTCTQSGTSERMTDLMPHPKNRKERMNQVRNSSEVSVRALGKDLNSRKYRTRTVEDKRESHRYKWLSDYDDEVS